MQSLFIFIERQKGSPKELVQYVCENDEKPLDAFALLLVEAAMENLPKLNVVLRAYANQTKYEKMAPINKALLLLGMTEIKYFATPPVVVINEYVEIAKVLGEETSAGFVNGVLDAFQRNLS